jgi:hypothetical protein
MQLWVWVGGGRSRQMATSTNDVGVGARRGHEQIIRENVTGDTALTPRNLKVRPAGQLAPSNRVCCFPHRMRTQHVGRPGTLLVCARLPSPQERRGNQITVGRPYMPTTTGGVPQAPLATPAKRPRSKRRVGIRCMNQACRAPRGPLAPPKLHPLPRHFCECAPHPPQGGGQACALDPSSVVLACSVMATLRNVFTAGVGDGRGEGLGRPRRPWHCTIGPYGEALTLGVLWVQIRSGASARIRPLQGSQACRAH